jgi:2-oxo-4-hydroxy-4-carboxy--5-ureidoimidazoline (OHCU) decarboxylase
MKTITGIYTIASIVLLGSASAWAQTASPSATTGPGKGEWREKWKQMTPEQKETFLKNHPKIAQWIAEHQQEMAANASTGNASAGSTTGSTTSVSATTGSATTGTTTTGSTTPTTPTTAGADNADVRQKWAQMTPEQKETFLQNHPKAAQQFSQNHPEAAQRLATTQEAGAGVTDPGHPRVNEVNGRATNQQNRIAQGASSGTLTAQQQAQLKRSGNRIQKQEGNDLAKNDGHLTLAEKARLNKEENRRGRHIYNDKHDS